MEKQALIIVLSSHRSSSAATEQVERRKSEKQFSRATWWNVQAGHSAVSTNRSRSSASSALINDSNLHFLFHAPKHDSFPNLCFARKHHERTKIWKEGEMTNDEKWMKFVFSDGKSIKAIFVSSRCFHFDNPFSFWQLSIFHALETRRWITPIMINLSNSFPRYWLQNQNNRVRREKD